MKLGRLVLKCCCCAYNTTVTLGNETSRAGGGDADDATDALKIDSARACLLAWRAKGKGKGRPERDTRLVRA
jgi:hypothetical protein